MSIKNMEIDELELLSYSDLSYLIIKENNSAYTILDLFREVCKLLELSNEEFEENLGDFYTTINLDKRFVLLKDNILDIVDRHSVEIEIDDEDDEEEFIEEEEEELDEEQVETIDDEDNDDDLDDEEDELEDLVILDEDELEDIE